MSDEEYQLDQSHDGIPMLLAVRAPGQIATQPDASGIILKRGAPSGNSNFDPKTGRFAGGGKAKGQTGDKGLAAKLTESAKKYLQQMVDQTGADGVDYAAAGTEVRITLSKGGSSIAVFMLPTIESSNDLSAATEAAVAVRPSGIPDGVDEETWNRRKDMVRDAAREMDEMGLGDAKEWLEGKVADLTSVNVEQFITDVRDQRLSDLADILDQQLRTKVDNMKRARRTVKVAAPRGFTKRVMAGLSDDEVLKLVKRLEGRGYDPEDLTKNVINKIGKEERRVKLEQLYGERAPKQGKKAKK